MSKDVIFNRPDQKQVQDKIRSGISKLADAVRVTLGPTGKVVMYEKGYGDPVLTKDGVTVAKQVELQDRHENMAASLLRQVASKTAKIAGDGTTTATIYAEAIFKEGLKVVNSGVNASELKRGIDDAVEAIVAHYENMATPVLNVDKIRQVAICSSNHDDLVGKIIAEAMDQVGQNGVITIEEGSGLSSTVNIIDGFQFNKGFVSNHFITDQASMVCSYDDARIFVTTYRPSLKDIVNIINVNIQKFDNGPLLIIADDFGDEVIATLAVNRIKSGIKICAVKAPGYGDRKRLTLEDIAIATGAKLVCPDGVPINNISASVFGKCGKFKADQDATTILHGGGNEDAINERVELLRSQLGNIAGDFDAEKIKERLARLSGGVAQILVGGATEAEVRERKDRVEDALHACKAAVEEGILPGGGIAAIHASKQIAQGDDDSYSYKLGRKIVLDAVNEPLRQLARNTGVDDGVIVNEVVSSNNINYGYNASTREFGDMYGFGIIVPTKVERVALQNAASIASLLLSTECMIALAEEPVRSDDTSPLASLMG